MTKSSVDRKRSRYGGYVTLRFHKDIKIYHLSCSTKIPMLLAKFTEVDGDLAIHCWETIEELYNENTRLKEDNVMLKQKIKKLEVENKALDDANDGLAGTLAHLDLEELM